MPRGRVVLLGAGPGDPELITLRGLRWLRRAEVVVYDHLVSPLLLEQAPPRALRVFAGKAVGRHCLPQSAIDALLVQHASDGRLVVRLKGGDPFVFGRGGEEALACVAAGIPVEVVPGVSSAVAVPAAAGIPVTHRGLASSFAVVTGHEDPAKAATRVDWERLAGTVDTLVILMGVAALPEIARRLLAAGRAPETPAAVVHRGTTPVEAVVTGPLRDIARRAAHLPPPSTIVIGDVVRLRERLDPMGAGVGAVHPLLMGRPLLIGPSARRRAVSPARAPRRATFAIPWRSSPGGSGIRPTGA